MNQFTKIQIIGVLFILFMFWISFFNDWTNRRMDFEALESRMKFVKQDLIDESLPKDQANIIVNAISRESREQSRSYYMNSLINRGIMITLVMVLFSMTISALKKKENN